MSDVTSLRLSPRVTTSLAGAAVGVLAFVLVAALFYAMRSTYTVSGTIDRVACRGVGAGLTPLVAQTFTLWVTTGAGTRLVYRGLRGSCGRQSGRAARLYDKAELPVGAPIELVVRGFSDPNVCGPWLDTPRYRRYVRGTMCNNRTVDSVSEIRVAGQAIAGWSNSAIFSVFYAWLAAVAVTLTLNGWRIGRVSPLLLTVFLVSALWLVVGVVR